MPIRSAVLLLLAGASMLPTFATAQTLDEQYLFYLYAKCEEMNFARDGYEILPGQAGPQLFAYCNGSFALPLGVDDAPSSAAGFSGTAGLVDQAARRRKAVAGDEQQDPAKSVDEATLFSSGQYSAYFSLNYAREEQDPTQFEGWHRSDALGLTLGLDRRLGTAGVIGIAALAEDSSGDLDEGGSVDQHAYGAMLYGSWLPTADSFIDVAAGWTSRNVDTRRIVALKGYFTYIGNTPAAGELLLYRPRARQQRHGPAGQARGAARRLRLHLRPLCRGSTAGWRVPRDRHRCHR